MTCGLSLSYFVDIDTVLGQVRHVLRSQGVFVATSWGPSRSDQAFSTVFSIYERHTEALPWRFRALLDEASWSDADRGRDIIRRSGFTSVDVVTRTASGRYPTADAALAWAFAWPLISDRVAQLEPGLGDALRTEALASVQAEGDLSWQRAVHYYRATV